MTSSRLVPPCWCKLCVGHCLHCLWFLLWSIKRSPSQFLPVERWLTQRILPYWFLLLRFFLILPSVCACIFCHSIESMLWILSQENASVLTLALWVYSLLLRTVISLGDSPVVLTFSGVHYCMRIIFFSLPGKQESAVSSNLLSAFGTASLQIVCDCRRFVRRVLGDPW